jgi:hypothetical protein
MKLWRMWYNQHVEYKAKFSIKRNANFAQLQWWSKISKTITVWSVKLWDFNVRLSTRIATKSAAGERRTLNCWWVNLKFGLCDSERRFQISHSAAVLHFNTRKVSDQCFDL